MRFAIFISRLLDPLWVIPAVTLLQAYPHGFLFSFVLMIVMLGIPLILRLLYMRGRNWDVSTRADRPKALSVLLVLGLVNIALAALWDIPSLTYLFILYELWMAGYLVISLFWKISGHAGAIALAVGLLIAWYGWIWWPALLLVPILGWARVVSKNHTVAQVATGIAYSFILLIAYETWRIIL